MYEIPFDTIRAYALINCALSENASNNEIQQEISNLKIKLEKCENDMYITEHSLYSLHIEMRYANLPVYSCMTCLIRAFFHLKAFYNGTTLAKAKEMDQAFLKYYKRKYDIQCNRYKIINARIGLLEELISYIQAHTPKT